jgi:hypothetical protein
VPAHDEPQNDPRVLEQRQRIGLWLDGREGLQTAEDAQGFLAKVGLALRYNATRDLPLASLYRATQRQIPAPEAENVAHARAFELTNTLLARGRAVEINVVANRLAVADMRLMPAIYALRRPDSAVDLSEVAASALEFIGGNGSASSGDVRRYLGVAGQARPDPADLALTELQRGLLIDRGPSSAPAQGIFYLSKEGYPYRILAQAHPDIPAAAAALARSQAALDLLGSYLRAAVFAFPRKLYTIFQLLLSREEIDAAITAMVQAGTAECARLGRAEAVVSYSGGG